MAYCNGAAKGAVESVVGGAHEKVKKSEKAKANEKSGQNIGLDWGKVKVSSFENETFGSYSFLNSSEKGTRKWSEISGLSSKMEGEDVWIRGRLSESRCKGSLGFVLIRHKYFVVQGVADVKSNVTKELIKWLGGVPIESVIDIFGTVVVPHVPVLSSTQDVEIAIKKVFCVSAAMRELPFQVKDANRVEDDDSAVIKVLQDVRFDNRTLDLRTFASQAIFSLSSMVCTLFREFLLDNGFVEIHSPKIIGGASEGGANVFTLKYFGRSACLAQSPQLYKQMAITGDFDKVFEIGPVFRAENSNTHRHLCEYVGLDLEMAFKESYLEVLEVIDEMFKYIFSGLNVKCREELAVIRKYFPVPDFTFLPSTPILTFEECMKMLRSAGHEVPDDLSDFDMSTELEKALGKLIRDKHDTDYYIVKKYPLKVRPFYTMPDPDSSELWSNSYDIFMRGEEIVSGAQRVHDPELLTERAIACGLDVETIKSYIDSFRLGSFPHAGCGIGLERVVMLFLGLGNIRRASLFPRDPKRLTP